MNRLRILVDYLTHYRTRILMYHSISDDASDPEAVSPKMFADQMDWLAAHGYQVLSLGQALANFEQGRSRRKGIVLTFDDGLVDFLEKAVPILRSHAFPAMLFVVAGETGGISNWRSLELQRPLLNWQGLKEVVRLGYEIGSHGLHHHDLTRLTFKELEAEIGISREILEQRLGVKVETFAYPWGLYTTQVVDIVRKVGYCSAVGVGSGWENGPETDRFHLERKTMSRADSLADFKHKVAGHEKLYGILKQAL